MLFGIYLVSKILLYLFICLHVCEKKKGGRKGKERKDEERTGGTRWEVVLCFHYMGPGD